MLARAIAHQFNWSYGSAARIGMPFGDEREGLVRNRKERRGPSTKTSAGRVRPASTLLNLAPKNAPQYPFGLLDLGTANPQCSCFPSRWVETKACRFQYRQVLRQIGF